MNAQRLPCSWSCPVWVLVLAALISPATAAAEPAAAPAAAAQSGPAEPWPLVCRISNYGRYQAAAWEHLQSLGIRHVFLSVPRPDQVDATLARLHAYGMNAAVIAGSLDLATPTGVDQSEAQFAALQRLGCRYLFVSPKHPGVSKQDAYVRLRRAGDLARRYGVTIVLETHLDLGTNGDVHLETMQAVNHPNVRVNFDTGNIHFYNRDTDAVTELKKILPYVATVEIKDHSGQYMQWNFPALGAGRVDIKGVLAVLREHGFQGPVTMEIEGIKGQPWDEAQTRDVIARSTAYLRALANFR